MIQTDTQAKYKVFLGSLKNSRARKVERIRELIFEVDDHINEEFDWKIPFYTMDGPICYINPKKSYIDIGFANGGLIDDEFDILEHGGLKVRHLKVPYTQQIPEKAIRDYVEQSIKINVGD